VIYIFKVIIDRDHHTFTVNNNVVSQTKINSVLFFSAARQQQGEHLLSRRVHNSAAAVRMSEDHLARLLLHTEDGVVPFLSPDLLQRCFPPSDFRDCLILGIAVRDTGIVPVFDVTKSDKKKPRGYIFSDKIRPDPWIVPYRRFTVPSFDLAEDAMRAGRMATVAISSKEVPLWTSNGRHTITANQYTSCVLGLGSESSVALFDMILPLAASTSDDTSQSKPESVEQIQRQKRTVKRRHLASSRNQNWFSECIRTCRADTDGRQFWAPFTVNPEATALDDLDKEHMNWIVAQKDIDGVAIIGWQYITSSRDRWRILESIAELCDKLPLAVLATNTTLQVLELLRLKGQVLIGTDLPAKWARAKKAFVCGSVAGCEANDAVDSNGCLDLNPMLEASHHALFRDRAPLVPGCTCLTCATHSRSYVFHLVCSKELLAEMLLFIHNLHHLLFLLRSKDKGSIDKIKCKLEAVASNGD
jgi:Queuine tRNA-ribosyltransferase